MTGRFTFLDEANTSQLMTMADAIAVCQRVLDEMGRGQAVLSQPASMFLKGAPEALTVFKVKGGFLKSSNACGFRVVGDVGEDGAEAEHHFCYLLDPLTAVPLALVAQTKLHRMRTAACGLIALQRLVSHDHPTIALIGAGRIAAHVAEGFSIMFPSARLIIASRRYESAAALADATNATAARSVEEAIMHADAVLALTTSHDPIFEPTCFRAGMTICGMGEYGELPAGLFRAADRFVVDDISFVKVLGSVASWIRSGQIPEAEIDSAPHVTLGDIVAGLAPGRRTPEEKVLAIVQGLAIADLAMAKHCLDKAMQSRSALN